MQHGQLLDLLAWAGLLAFGVSGALVAVQKRFDLYPFLLYHSFMTVADHLTLSELEQRVKKAGDPVEKARFLAVYHAKRGLTAKEIGKITLHSTRSFSRWCGATTKKALRP